MNEHLNKSEYYHFGILPQICIHSPHIDQYSHMYKPQDVCDCGCTDWLTEGCTIILGHYRNGIPVHKDVHRCAKCNEVRIAHHIGIKDE